MGGGQVGGLCGLGSGFCGGLGDFSGSLGSLGLGLGGFGSGLGSLGGSLVFGSGSSSFLGGLLSSFGSLLGLLRLLLGFFRRLLGGAGSSQQVLCGFKLELGSDHHILVGHGEGRAFNRGAVHLQGAFLQDVALIRQYRQSHQGALGCLGGIGSDGTVGHVINGNVMNHILHIHCGGSALAGICVGSCSHRHNLRRLVHAQEQLAIFDHGLGAGVAADGPGYGHIIAAGHSSSKLALLAGVAVHSQLCGVNGDADLFHRLRGSGLLTIQLNFKDPDGVRPIPPVVITIGDLQPINAAGNLGFHGIIRDVLLVTRIALQYHPVGVIGHHGRLLCLRQGQEGGICILLRIQNFQREIIGIEAFILRLRASASMGHLQPVGVGSILHVKGNPVGSLLAAPLGAVVVVKGHLRLFPCDGSHTGTENADIFGQQFRLGHFFVSVQLQLIHTDAVAPVGAVGITDIDLENPCSGGIQIINRNVFRIIGSACQQRPIAVVCKQGGTLFIGLGQELFHCDLFGIQGIELISSGVDGAGGRRILIVGAGMIQNSLAQILLHADVESNPHIFAVNAPLVGIGVAHCAVKQLLRASFTAQVVAIVSNDLCVPRYVGLFIQFTGFTWIGGIRGVCGIHRFLRHGNGGVGHLGLIVQRNGPDGEGCAHLLVCGNGEKAGFAQAGALVGAACQAPLHGLAEAAGSSHLGGELLGSALGHAGRCRRHLDIGNGHFGIHNQTANGILQRNPELLQLVVAAVVGGNCSLGGIQCILIDVEAFLGILGLLINRLKAGAQLTQALGTALIAQVRISLQEICPGGFRLGGSGSCSGRSLDNRLGSGQLFGKCRPGGADAVGLVHGLAFAHQLPETCQVRRQLHGVAIGHRIALGIGLALFVHFVVDRAAVFLQGHSALADHAVAAGRQGVQNGRLGIGRGKDL